MNIVILGPQGSGKGTQAKLIADKFGLFHMESGQMLREISEKDERIRNMLNKGILVPTQETINYMDKYIKQKRADFTKIIFDGYPRDKEQYVLLTQWMKKVNDGIDYFIYINISKEETIKRLSSRRICRKCLKVYNLATKKPEKIGTCSCGGKLFQRDDDKPKTIKKRLQIFENETKPILEMAKKETVVLKIDGERPIGVIFEDIKAKLKKYAKSKN